MEITRVIANLITMKLTKKNSYGKKNTSEKKFDILLLRDVLV